MLDKYLNSYFLFRKEKFKLSIKFKDCGLFFLFCKNKKYKKRVQLLLRKTKSVKTLLVLVFLVSLKKKEHFVCKNAFLHSNCTQKEKGLRFYFIKSFFFYKVKNATT